ncbi:centrosomal and chromosomal factor [Phlebotomus argentipes]|uniref:centrosomal and chromosomal factor n=1 Tax=Phlebotomus argentipes TaxID=94469 RepID=UPI0028934E44|nr:centrosomal and chromosomal factor [Phlebotomus argentipes]
MAMAACYGSYDLGGGQGVTQHHQQQQTHQSNRLSGPPQKDYSIPLHVDCSVEYELPNAAKPPAGARVEPLLMIHPCYFRKMESQRRSPFINNMPNSSRSATTAAGSVITGTAPAVAGSRRSSRASSQVHHAHHMQLAQQIQQQQMSQMSQQAQYPASNGQSAQATNTQYIEQARRAVIHSHGGQQSAQQPQNPGSASWNHMGIPASVNMTGQSMYSKPVGKRDAMLSGGCGIYSSTNNDSHSARWEPERSPMAAIPRDYQAGPDATPAVPRDDKHILSGKYRQYLRAHRLHPYMMATGSVSSSFPQLTASAFPQMQQVTCYNV